MKVLLVDDEIAFVNTLSNRLELRGISTDVVHDGQEALDYVAKQEPDVMVLDLEMPRVHGMDVLRQLSKTNPKIQVVIMTAFGQEAREKEANNLDAFDFLNKPVDI
ncbi:MAG: response regulator, partial [Deltaproteobacteria bacterium]|nr:response regulator [Deltaproteobacteria bacterium]